MCMPASKACSFLLRPDTFLYQPKTTMSNTEVMSRDFYHVLKGADAVCFDVDSTLIRHEGIDLLADACGVGEAVEQLTRRAMSGGMSFTDALKLRLNLIKPTLNQINKLVNEQMADLENFLTAGVRELVELLHRHNISVYVVSGGFRRFIEPVAISLGIRCQNIFCNNLLFNDKGEYTGFDEKQHTCRDGGKGLVMKDIKKIHKYVIMIGDGMTDFQASPPADVFIGFGGNVERLQVKKVAPWYIYDMQELVEALMETDSDDEDTPSSSRSLSPPRSARPLNNECD